MHLFLFPSAASCSTGILFPRPVIEPVPAALGAQSLFFKTFPFVLVYTAIQMNS